MAEGRQKESKPTIGIDPQIETSFAIPGRNVRLSAEIELPVDLGGQHISPIAELRNEDGEVVATAELKRQEGLNRNLFVGSIFIRPDLPLGYYQVEFLDPMFSGKVRVPIVVASRGISDRLDHLKKALAARRNAYEKKEASPLVAARWLLRAAKQYTITGERVLAAHAYVERARLLLGAHKTLAGARSYDLAAELFDMSGKTKKSTILRALSAGLKVESEDDQKKSPAVGHDWDARIPPLGEMGGRLLIVFRNLQEHIGRLVRSGDNRRVELRELKPVVIAGAGMAGSMVAQEIQANPRLGKVAVGFLDDDPIKIGKRIHGVPVLGRLDELPAVCTKYGVSEVLIAMPTAPGNVVRGIVRLAREAGIESKTVPGLFEILEGTARVEQVRNIQVEDLLRRAPASTNSTLVLDLFRGARVLVAGAGGSIGSELCRQIVGFGPTELVILGHGEYSVSQIRQELEGRHLPGLTISPVVADIRDQSGMRLLFEHFKPDIVFHAAGHKSVALMEVNVRDAVTTNILGTKVVVDLASKFGVKRFVMISSVSAVNPTSVMGATKRVAELVVQDAARNTGGAFVSVRAGDVLESRGNLVETFRRQIAYGGPVEVPHPDMSRFFMTTAEAIQLALEASAHGAGEGIYVLDMGEQIKIVDLALDMIRLRGLQEGEDIAIVFTGLPPGEKLHQDPFYAQEAVQVTRNPRIFITGVDPQSVESEKHFHSELGDVIGELISGIESYMPDATIKRLLSRLVPEYSPEMSSWISRTRLPEERREPLDNTPRKPKDWRPT